MSTIRNSRHDIARIMGEKRHMTARLMTSRAVAGLGRLWNERLRPIAYWLLCAYLLVNVAVSIGDFFGYLENPSGYHQVYRNAELQQAIGYVYGIAAAFAIPFQFAGWRTTQNSWIAIGFFLLQICFGQVEDHFNFIGLCCG